MDDRRARAALVEAGMALTSELSLDGILERLVAAAAELTGARYAALGVLDRHGERLERFLTHGLTADEQEAIGPRPTGRGILGVLIHDPRPLRLTDLTRDPRAVGFPPDHPPMRSFLGVPVLLRGASFGRLYLTEKNDGEFTAEDEELVQLLAAQAAVAIELSQRVERDALRRAVAAQEVERRRLARELHDETGQALTSILLGLTVVERASTPAETRAALDELRTLVVQTLQDVRTLAVELRPKALDDFGLEPALRRLGQSITETGAVDVQVEVRLGDARLSGEVETAVYRIVQEALTNVVKHAGARHVSVVVTRGRETLSVVVEDDGVGFDPTAGSAGLGLLGMRERIELLDGRMSVESSAETGTALVFELAMPL